jgi:divinyl chlorophyllide a 8-vinyl-reductase
MQAAAAPRQPRAARQLARAVAAAAGGDYRQRAPGDVRVLVVGATGYIGKFVVKELVARGYNVVAFAREKSGIGGKQGQEDVLRELAGADVRFGDVGSMDSLSAVAFKDKVDVVVSCLASRTGARAGAVGHGAGQGRAARASLSMQCQHRLPATAIRC